MFNASDSTSNSTMTPVPFSPFSSTFSSSDATGTSEEPGDLGANITNVFRALAQLRNPYPQYPPPNYVDIDTDVPNDTASFVSSSAPSSSISSSDEEDEDEGISLSTDSHERIPATVWSEAPVASYLTTSSKSDLEDDQDGPSLGALEAALLFLAKERERLTSKLDRNLASPIDDPRLEDSLTAVEAEPKRRRKDKPQRKGRKERRRARRRVEDEVMDGNESRTETVAEVSSSNDSHDTQALQRHSSKADPELVPIFRQSKRSKRGHAKSPSGGGSTPALHSTSMEATSLKIHLTSLANRLSGQFPADARALRSMVFDTDRLVAGAASFAFSERIEMEGFYDPRPLSGAMSDDARLHVFVDHSNILVGFLEWFKRQSTTSPAAISVPGSSVSYTRPVKPKLSHASLILLLERGRPCGKRVLVASSPLHQGIDDIVEMGYEVSVLQRVAIKEGASVTPASASTPNGSVGIRPSGYDRRRNSQNPDMLPGTSSSPPRNNSTKGEVVSAGSSTESAQSTHGTGAFGPARLNRNLHPSHIGHRRYPSAPSTFPSMSAVSSMSSLPTIRDASMDTVPVTLREITRPAPYPLVTPAYTHASQQATGGSPYSVVSPYDLSASPVYLLPPSAQHGAVSSPAVPQYYNNSSKPYYNTNHRQPPSGSPPTLPSRTRFREEAVDELLQLKLLQVLVASTDQPPRGSTIVLATGDGASSQFNREGFLGCVRQAVERGWRVELVGWEDGRSRAWSELAWEISVNRKEGRNTTSGGLSMVDLDKWGWDLVDESGLGGF